MSDIINDTIEEINKIIPHERELITLNGDKIELPKITLGMELSVLRAYLEFLKAGGYKEKDLKDLDIRSIFINALSEAKGIDKILEIFAIIVDKPIQWLQENVDLISMIECILPFFVARVQAITKAVREILE